MLKDRAFFFPLFAPGIAMLVTGCGGYTSSYVPPADGRPRVVWSDDKPVAMMANPMPAQCAAAVDSLAGGGELKVGRVSTGHVSGGYYVPRTVVVVHGGPGFIPPVPRMIVPHVSVGGGGGIKSGGAFSGGGGHSGGGGSGDLGKGAIVLVVVAIASLPFIALGLALGRPEPEAASALAIDQVNAHTDLARTQGSACDEVVVAGQVDQ